MYYHDNNETICAPATAQGHAAIAVIRLSGPSAFSIAESLFVPRKKGLHFTQIDPFRATLGHIRRKDETVDEVLLIKYAAPRSYTGEEMVEVSCHGSPFIQQQIVSLMIEQGARMARPGEFTLRAFLNGRLDLSQAEAVADLIASNSEAARKIAFQQMRGHFSERISELRRQLVEFASLIELELDFSEEDVEFADRDQLRSLLGDIGDEVARLRDSFAAGNAIKQGIPVAIIGKPNVGKSTLLNALLNEERAIVSEIPGTTRDAIEDTIVLNGTAFRFIDTAGLREGGDAIEAVGIERTYEKVEQASIILYLFDVSTTTIEEITETISGFQERVGDKGKKMILVANKIDLLEEIPHHFRNLVDLETVFVSAKRKENISLITDSLLRSMEADPGEARDVLVTNSRHYEALMRTAEAVASLEKAMDAGVSGDLLAIDLRSAMHYLGTITGEITSDEVLGEIFGKFCIGK